MNRLPFFPTSVIRPLATCLFCLIGAASSTPAGEFALRDQELPTRLTVGYAVRLVDMNGDKRLDIAIVVRGTFLNQPNAIFANGNIQPWSRSIGECGFDDLAQAVNIDSDVGILPPIDRATIIEGFKRDLPFRRGLAGQRPSQQVIEQSQQAIGTASLQSPPRNFGSSHIARVAVCQPVRTRSFVISIHNLQFATIAFACNRKRQRRNTARVAGAAHRIRSQRSQTAGINSNATEIKPFYFSILKIVT